MADLNKKAIKFNGSIKLKDHVKVKNHDYGIKSEKSDVPKSMSFMTKKKKEQFIKPSLSDVRQALIRSSDHVKVKNHDYDIKSEKQAVAERKTFMIKKTKFHLVRGGVSSFRKAVISSSIKAAENSENAESSEGTNLTIGKVYHNQQNVERYMKGIKKNYQRHKKDFKKYKKQSQKQRGKETSIKKSRERHASKVINRKDQTSIKGIKKSKQLVKAKNAKVIRTQQASRRVKKVVGKTGVKLTAGTIKGLKAKAVLLKIGSSFVGGAKAISSLVALKFLVPIGLLGIALILIVSVLVAIVGIIASVDPFIPIAEEVLVTEIHVHLTELDIDWNEANGTSIQTDSKDVIALVFMGGGVDPKRENNDAILTEVTEFHQAFHESGASDMVSFLANHPVLSIVASDFLEFREFAFVHFYGILGDPYERDWSDAVTSHFGWRPDPFGSGDREMHNGIDIAWAGIGGTPVLATISGTVQVARYNSGGYGNWVMIVNDDDPDNRKETRYAHLRTMSVSVGQRVEVGDVVGLTGTTGSSTGDHLHHEFRRNGNLLNPYFYFPNDDLKIGKVGGE